MKLTREKLESLLDSPRLDHRGENLYATCPWCGEYEFGISLKENHPWNCFRKKKCEADSGNIYKLLKKLGRSSEFISQREIDVFDKLESSLSVKENTFIDSLPEIKPPFGWKRSYDDLYLIDRGFTEDQFHKFEVGRSFVNKSYVTILCRMNGILTGYVSRSVKEKDWIDAYNNKVKETGEGEIYPRYKNSTTDFEQILFGYDEIVDGVTKDVILTEGIFSKTKTDLNLELDSSSDLKCCATFGSKFSDSHIILLKSKGVERLFFWFEADVLSSVKKAITNAASHFEVFASYIKGNDPNDFDQDEAIRIFESSVPWSDYNINYLQSKLV